MYSTITRRERRGPVVILSRPCWNSCLFMLSYLVLRETRWRPCGEKSSPSIIKRSQTAAHFRYSMARPDISHRHLSTLQRNRAAAAKQSPSQPKIRQQSSLVMQKFFFLSLFFKVRKSPLETGRCLQQSAVPFAFFFKGMAKGEQPKRVGRCIFPYSVVIIFFFTFFFFFCQRYMNRRDVFSFQEFPARHKGIPTRKRDDRPAGLS